MRAFPDEYLRKLTSDKLKTVYENFDKYEDAEFLSNTLGFNVILASQDERKAFYLVDKTNTESVKVVIASFPNYIGTSYLVINYEDRMKAAEIGLNLLFI